MLQYNQYSLFDTNSIVVHNYWGSACAYQCPSICITFCNAASLQSQLPYTATYLCNERPRVLNCIQFQVSQNSSEKNHQQGIIAQNIKFLIKWRTQGDNRLTFNWSKICNYFTPVGKGWTMWKAKFKSWNKISMYIRGQNVWSLHSKSTEFTVRAD